MKKYIVYYTNNKKKNVGVVRYAESREEAVRKICRQYGWNEDVAWLSDENWDDGIILNKGRGFGFRIKEVEA